MKAKTKPRKHIGVSQKRAKKVSPPVLWCKPLHEALVHMGRNDPDWEHKETDTGWSWNMNELFTPYESGQQWDECIKETWEAKK